MSKQSRCFCFTLNNYVDADCPDPLRDDVEYACWGEEKAPTTGTPHLQGVLYFHKKVTLKGVIRKNYFDGLLPSYKLCRGTLKQNLVYVQKDGRFHEFGVLPADPGAIGGAMEKSRWEEIHAAVSAPTFDLAKLAETHPQECILHFDRMDRFRDRTRPSDPSRSTLENYWIVGETGRGKSRKAETYRPDSFVKWDDPVYFGPEFAYQKCLIIDEVTPGWPTFKMMSKMSDHAAFTPRMMYRMPAKWRPEVVVVTSNYTIEQCYGHDADAINRRFKVIRM